MILKHNLNQDEIVLCINALNGIDSAKDSLTLKLQVNELNYEDYNSIRLAIAAAEVDNKTFRSAQKDGTPLWRIYSQKIKKLQTIGHKLEACSTQNI